MANFAAFRWNFSSSTNSEIGRSDIVSLHFDVVVADDDALISEVLKSRPSPVLVLALPF